MTVITLPTIGFKKVQPLSPEGKLFTIVLIISGTGMIAYTLSSLLQFTLEGQLRKILGRRKLESRISKLSGHYIFCRFGRIAHHVCREFQSRPMSFVPVEKNPHHRERRIRQSMSIIIVGIKQVDGQMMFNPPLTSVIEPNSVLITLEKRPEINQLEKIAGGIQQ